MSADLTGQANHLGVTIEADIIKQKLPENNGGYNALSSGEPYGKIDKRVYDRADERPPDRPVRYQVANCYMGRAGLINSGGASGENDFAEAVRTAVINKRAGGMGLISGRKAFQRPMAEGVELLNAIQDVYDIDSAPQPRGGGGTERPTPEALAPLLKINYKKPVIRFAGDSGDGMQLTGDRFTRSSARSATTSRRCPTSRPRSEPRGHGRRRVRLPGPHLRPRHHHAGRRPQRARGDEPGGAATTCTELEQGGTLIVNTDTFDERNLEKAGYDEQPARGRLARGYRVIEVPMTSLTKEA